MRPKIEKLFEEAVPPSEGELARAEALRHADESEREKRIETLGALKDSEGWRIVLGEIVRMNENALQAVVKPGRGIEDIRFAQGQIDALASVVAFVEKGDKT